ncbi:MAG: response regulator, partial [Pseudomonadales bacterium]
VKRVIEQQHGEISMRDRTGGGTEVSLRWPEVKDFKPPSGSESPGPGTITVQSESDPVQPGTQILVVDDDERILLVAKSLLESLGYAVSTAQDADEAVSVFVIEHDQIAAVLLDLKMPGKDGWTCLAELREVCAQTRIVICSGFNPEQQLPDEARHDQHLQFLNKPFRLEQLAEVLS